MAAKKVVAEKEKSADPKEVASRWKRYASFGDQISALNAEIGKIKKQADAEKKELLRLLGRKLSIEADGFRVVRKIVHVPAQVRAAYEYDRLVVEEV